MLDEATPPGGYLPAPAYASCAATRVGCFGPWRGDEPWSHDATAVRDDWPTRLWRDRMPPTMLDTPLPSPGLLNRTGERDALERLVADVRAGQSRVLVLCGEAGVGKTALLAHLAAVAEGCRIARTAGVESEMELAFAGLHALCAPMLDRL